MLSFCYPQVSFFSTSPELSNKARFEYFTRTIPSDLHQVRAMVEIVKKLGWRYVSIIYEESNYGIKVIFQCYGLIRDFENISKVMVYIRVAMKNKIKEQVIENKYQTH